MNNVKAKIAPFRLLRIAVLNDQLRRTFRGGRVAVTPGVSALPQSELQAVLNKVREYDEFTPTNDPYGEHNFGCFYHKGERFLFQIDYYTKDMMHRSEDPGNEERTLRVLTIKKAIGY